MNEVTVEKGALLEVLKKNREAHRGIFEKAQERYRERVLEELEKSLQDAQAGRHFRRHIELPEPEDHTGDYDRIIRMVEMSVKVDIELTQGEFATYVMDDWNWKRAWTTNTLAYTQHV